MDRESDVLYEELLKREEDEEAAGILPSEFSPRPRARGGRLTEQNLKVWTTMVSACFICLEVKLMSMMPRLLESLRRGSRP
jgi:hypothetical protein